MMYSLSIKSGLMLLAMLASTSAHAAVDSYRFTHVTIATPWYIFIFLLMAVFVPFVLMAVLSWRVAMKKTGSQASDVAHKPIAD